MPVADPMALVDEVEVENVDRTTAVECVDAGDVHRVVAADHNRKCPRVEDGPHAGGDVCMAARRIGMDDIGIAGIDDPNRRREVRRIVLVIVAPGVYDGFFRFLVWTSALNSALAGIGIADYLILRRQRLDLRALHSTASSSAYKFWCGFNPIGLFSLLAGFVIYVAVFNPQSLEHAPDFRIWS